MKNLVLTIVGGGNSGHVLAGLAPKDVEARLLTRRPGDWDKKIKVFSENHTPISEGHLSIISSNPEEVIPGSDIIVICSPVHIYDRLLSKIAPYVSDRSHVGSLFGQGCTHFLARTLLPNSYFFAFQTIPWICRAIQYGKKARIYGVQKQLRAATNSPDRGQKLFATLKRLIGDCTIEFLPNFLSTTLVPSNQIVHPGRYYGIFHDWDGVSPYSEEEIPLLYSDMDKFSAECMLQLSNELQSIKKGIISHFPDLNLDYVKPIEDRLIEDFSDLVEDKSSLKTIFATSQAHRGIKTPVREVTGGFAPDPNTRLFEDDIPYGLCILKGYAEMLKIDTPWIDRIVEWHQKLMGKEYIVNGQLVGKDAKNCGSLASYGIRKLKDAVI